MLPGVHPILAISMLCLVVALLSGPAAAVPRASPRAGPTCCSAEKKCCSQTFAPPLAHACDAATCCDAACGAVAAEAVLAAPAVARVRNAYGRKLSADCCDTFHADGSLCRRDLGGNCSAARRCKAFVSDCGACDTVCVEFLPASGAR